MYVVIELLACQMLPAPRQRWFEVQTLNNGLVFLHMTGMTIMQTAWRNVVSMPFPSRPTSLINWLLTLRQKLTLRCVMTRTPFL